MVPLKPVVSATLTPASRSRVIASCGTVDRLGVSFVDELLVGALEGGVRLLCALLGSEQRAEDTDLGLAHGVEHVLPARCPAPGPTPGTPTAVAAASNALTTSPSSATVVPAMSITAS